MVNIYVDFVEFESSMLHAKFQDHLVLNKILLNAFTIFECGVAVILVINGQHQVGCHNLLSSFGYYASKSSSSETSPTMKKPSFCTCKQ